MPQDDVAPHHVIPLGVYVSNRGTPCEVRGGCREAARARIARNAAVFGVSVDVRGAAPDAFNGAATPSAVFVGGGLSQPGVLDACLDNLAAPGGLVANAAMVESDVVLAQSYSR